MFFRSFKGTNSTAKISRRSVGLDVRVLEELLGTATCFGVSSGEVSRDLANLDFDWRNWRVWASKRPSINNPCVLFYPFTTSPKKKMNECSMKRDHFKTKKSCSFTMIFQSQQVFLLYSLFLGLNFHHHLFRNLTNIQIPNRQHPVTNKNQSKERSPELPGQLL